MKWICVGNVHDIVPGMGRPFRTPEGKEIGVFHLTDGRVLAVENRCPHRGGPLSEGLLSGHFVFCPFHDRKIDLETGQVQPPDTGCTPAYAVEIRGDNIWVEC